MSTLQGVAQKYREVQGIERTLDQEIEVLINEKVSDSHLVSSTHMAKNKSTNLHNHNYLIKKIQKDQ